MVAHVRLANAAKCKIRLKTIKVSKKWVFFPNSRPLPPCYINASKFLDAQCCIRLTHMGHHGPPCVVSHVRQQTAAVRSQTAQPQHTLNTR